MAGVQPHFFQRLGVVVEAVDIDWISPTAEPLGKAQFRECVHHVGKQLTEGRLVRQGRVLCQQGGAPRRREPPQQGWRILCWIQPSKGRLEVALAAVGAYQHRLVQAGEIRQGGKIPQECPIHHRTERATAGIVLRHIGIQRPSSLNEFLIGQRKQPLRLICCQPCILQIELTDLPLFFLGVKRTKAIAFDDGLVKIGLGLVDEQQGRDGLASGGFPY